MPRPGTDAAPEPARESHPHPSLHSLISLVGISSVLLGLFLDVSLVNFNTVIYPKVDPFEGTKFKKVISLFLNH